MGIWISNLLLAAGSALTLPLVLDSKGWGPEGPVGAPLLTGALALLQVAALAMCIQRGAFDWAPGGRLWMYVLLLGYFLVMTMLPIMAVGSGTEHSLYKAVTLSILAAAFAAVNLSAALQSSIGARIIIGGSLGAAGGAGLLLIAFFMVQSFGNSIRAADEEARHHAEFQEEQRQFQLTEFRKLGPNAELWQLIQYAGPMNPAQKECLAQMASKPNLEAEMIELLGTGWAEHAVSYVRDHYPLPYRGLAPAYAAFLDKQLQQWESTVLHDEYGRKWEFNLRPLFQVAGKITGDGGDVRPPLERWRALFRNSKGLQFMTADVDDALKGR